ncbi:glycosyl transferase family 2 [bacterium BMS3Bbin10]|nr:glycosyl transferase family 2 [bacterium BMS3Bbin10]
MISVIIPTLNAEAGLTATLSALVPGSVKGLVREVIISDGGSSDATPDIADAAGAQFIRGPKGRGLQLAAGAEQARSGWLLFLHGDTVLQPGWESEVSTFIERVDGGARPAGAAAFSFALDDFGARPRMLEAMVSLRCALLRFPFGDQGLLIPKRLYDSLGGYRPLPLMEDVDLVRRLGRRRLVMMRTKAVTSAVRYKRDGYIARIARNAVCLSLYYLRVPPGTIVRLYG